MKILMCNKYHFVLGGTERYLFDLMQGLRDDQHEVIVFAARHPKNRPSVYADYFVESDDYARPQKKDMIRIDKALRFVYSRRAQRSLEKLLADHRPDIAHIHNIYHHLTPSVLTALRKHHIPMVMTVHDYKLICPNYSLFTEGRVCERCKQGRYYEAVLHRCVKDSRVSSALAACEMTVHRVLRSYERAIDVFIAPSKFVMQKLIDFGISARKIVHLPLAIDLTRYVPAYEPGAYVLYAGTLYPKKGVHVLLEAARRLPEVEFKIAGEGPMRTELERLIARNHLTNVQLVGYLDEDELKEAFAGALCVVVPSVWYEVACLTIYEAFASGKCVVASAIGAIPEIVRDGENGFLCEPGNARELADKIAFLVAHREKNIAMSRRAYEGIQTVRPAAHYQSMMELYNTCIIKTRYR